MQVADFDYELPERLIAQQPPAVRGASRLLRVDRESLTDASFPDLEHLLAPGDLLVLNDTRVIPARLLGRKDTGGRVEVMVERVLDRGRLRAQLRASKTPRIGTVIGFGDGLSLAVADRAGGFFDLEVGGDGDVSSLLAAHGTVPLPPYIRRAPAAAGSARHQTGHPPPDALPEEPGAAIGRALPSISRAVLKATGATDFNVLQNNGRPAHQFVGHVHFHIIPKREDGTGLGIEWNAMKLEDEDAAALAGKIAAAIRTG